MPSLEYFVVADSISVDQDSDRISLFHIVEEVSATDLPARVPRPVAVSSWRVQPEEYGRDFQVTLKIHRPWEEKQPAYQEFAINFTAERERHRMHHFVVGLPIRQPGDLEFEVLLNGEHAARHIVTIRPLSEVT